MSEEQASTPAVQYLGGLSLFLYRAIRNSLPLIVVVTLLVATIAYFAAPRLAPIYAAQASIEIGRVAGADAMGLQAAVARVNAQSFKRRVLQLLNLPDFESNRGSRLLFDSLTAKLEGQDMLTASIRGPSEQQVRQALDLVVRVLNEDQDKFREPVLADINSQIAEIDENIAGLMKVREALLALTKASTSEATPEDQADDWRRVSVLDMLSRNKDTLTAARVRRRELASRLSSWNTYPTAIVGDVLVSPSAGLPRPSKIALIAATFTFTAFLLYTLLRGRKIVHPN